MKIITKCVISFVTLEVIEEEFYEYNGLISECKGGGGGSSSGTVDYPAHMKTWHTDALSNSGADTITSSMTDCMNAAIGSSPWSAQAAFDPDTILSSNDAAIAAFAAILAAINYTTNWSSLFTQAVTSVGSSSTITVADTSISDITITDASITDKSITNISDTTTINGITEAIILADVSSFADQIDDEITTKILPRFEAGMRNINAVQSSAFVVGESIIEGFRNREVSKHSSGLRLAAATKNTDIDIENEQLHLEVKKTNIMKDIEIAKLNLNKDIEVTKSNLSKTIEVNKLNTEKNIEVAKINTQKAIQVADANVRYVAEYDKMYLEGTSQMLQLMMQKIAWDESYTKTFVEANRIKIVAKKEETDGNMDIDKNDALWDLEVFQFGANLLASIGSGTMNPNAKGPSQMQSALGGAMMGVAAGAMTGMGPPAMVAGGLLGVASSFM